ncbi:MAG TPA: electron transfer flavoprotein subunit alpha, partial [Parvularcula sp.]|nr:electron transfer flavoprotein subunit alpha [Parvularcula sp.]
MAVLVVADHNNNALADSVAKAVTAAQKLGGDIDILVAGDSAGGAAAEAAKLSGVRKVLHADDAAYGKLLAEPVAKLIVSKAGSYDAFVAPATANGKNIMPRVAALLDVMQISDAIAIESADTFVRPIYAGNAIATVQSTDPKKVVTVRTATFKAAEATGSATIEKIGAEGDPAISSFVGEEIVKSDRPELTAAKIVISGGRALGSHENFEKLIYPIADKLGAAVGASRAAVDAGYMPNDTQVGQTGKVVAPQLYIAVGISGAIQHLAGMKDS